jgi:predicted dehydrogenase
MGVLAAVVDSREEQARSTGARFHVPAFARLEDLLEGGGIDAVAIATPADTHAALSLVAIEAGLDVFVEKPMATRVVDGERMVKLAAERGRVLMVGHLLEYHGAVRRLKELVDSNALGKLEYAYSNRLNMGRVRREENALWSFAPHDVAVLLLLVGEMPIQVTATGGSYLQPNVADVTMTNLLFDGGLRAHIFVSWLHPFKEQKLVVTGTRRMAVFNDVLAESKLVLFDRNIENVQGELVAHQVEGTAVSYDPAEPLRTELEHFVECIATRAKPRTDGLNGLRVLSVLQASQRSIQVNGEPIVLRANLQEIIWA